jgi:hypothetical protein
MLRSKAWKPIYRKLLLDKEERLCKIGEINNYGAVEDIPLEEARRQMEVNVFGLARMIQLMVEGDVLI